MALNKRGQEGIFFMFMIGIVIIILSLALATPLIKSSNQVRTTMDCDNSSISTDRKVSCGVTDIVTPTFTAILLGLGALGFGAKVVFG
jgi:hypothetical protein